MLICELKDNSDYCKAFFPIIMGTVSLCIVKRKDKLNVVVHSHNPRLGCGSSRMQGCRVEISMGCENLLKKKKKEK